MQDLSNMWQISVSADGSTWFLGLLDIAGEQFDDQFQYPLMDRLGFWGLETETILPDGQLFQYPLMDRLGFWGLLLQDGQLLLKVISVSADGSTWFLGMSYLAPDPPTSKISVSADGSTWFLGIPSHELDLQAIQISVSADGSTWFLGVAAALSMTHAELHFSIR